MASLWSRTLHSHDINDLEEFKEGELSSTERAVLDSVVWRKLDRRLVPLCTGWFVLSLVDRINIGSSRVVGMQQALGMSNFQYTMALTATYVSYLVAQLPSSLLMKYVGPDIMLPAMVTLWGAVSAFQGLVVNPEGLIACRVFLGVFEGGLFPGIVLYLSSFYPRKRLQIRIASFFAYTNLFGALSGLLPVAIDQISEKSGKPGWAWIFIVEGIFTFVFGAISFFLLPRSPKMARFLTEKERLYVVSILKDAGSVSEDDRKDNFSWREVINSARSLHVWLLAIASFFGGATLFGLAYFEPTIVSSLGYSESRALLMSVPPYVTNVIWALVTGAISDRYRCRGYTLIFLSVLQLAGFTTFYVSRSNHVRYGSLFLSLPGTFCGVPTLTTWLSNNSAPHARRATAVAMGSVTAELGGIFSTWLLGYLSPGPAYTSASITFMTMPIATIVLSMANLVYLWRENRLKAERRERMKKEEEPEELGDRSAWFIYSL